VQIHLYSHANLKGSFEVRGNVAFHMWRLHLILVYFIAKRKKDRGEDWDTDWISAYRWHAGRVAADTPYVGLCIACGERQSVQNPHETPLPTRCPKCGHGEPHVPPNAPSAPFG
jgi:hypothetical protein